MSKPKGDSLVERLRQVADEGKVLLGDVSAFRTDVKSWAGGSSALEVEREKLVMRRVTLSDRAAAFDADVKAASDDVDRTFAEIQKTGVEMSYKNWK